LRFREEIACITLAYRGAVVAPVESLLVASMGSFGTVVQPLKPRIGVKTLLVRHKTTPHPKVANEFLGHCQSTGQAYGNRPNCLTVMCE
jgi:hypothetical protein